MESESETEELVEHTIEIDKYTQLTLKIPKVMSAMDLKGLMVKANKIFNVSEVSITGRNGRMGRPPGSGRGHRLFTPEIDAKMYKLRETDKLSWSKIDDALGITNTDKHYHYLKKKNRWNKNLLKAEG